MNAVMLAVGFLVGGLTGKAYERRYPNESARQMVAVWIGGTGVVLLGAWLAYDVFPSLF